MMISPFFSELPSDIGDASVWRARQGGHAELAPDAGTAAAFQFQVLAARPMLTRMAHRAGPLSHQPQGTLQIKVCTGGSVQ